MIKKSKLSFGLTAFLDILGFGAQVATANTQGDLQALLKSIKRIRKAFEHKPRDAAEREIHAAYAKTVLAFSDSVIVNVPLASKMTEVSGTFDAFMSELHSMACAQASCIEHALFLRGGVDLDWWYRDGSTLVSKSLANAYAQEGTACVPVIAVTDRVYEFLAKHQERKAYSTDSDPLPRMIREYTGVVAGKSIHVRFLDYLSIFAREIDWTPTSSNRSFLLGLPEEARDQQMEAWRLENLRYWFAGHARTIEMAHGGTNVPSVQAKYQWLAEYHNAVALVFTQGDPSCICVL
ncbi:hypothetical protein [Pelomonas cellulosilytica]|uniref:Uncharacterized protein n=1 Tax=Pelomonas cellulosilytica TaxID=2906762 RepID=A0ABS8XU77_9BURK|nr:hypothetical protein [Pelomonas sp. P8]MCE4556269.1 hypothetical protein [Pelomonas sp. P8]